MRVLAFAMPTHLEAVMLAAIRVCFSHEEDAVDKLGADAAAQVLGDLTELYAKQLDPALPEVTSLRQKGALSA
jgi:hypothetical protein